MSLLNFIYDIEQDGQIRQLKDEIQTLKQRIDILEQWIHYYNDRRSDRSDIRQDARAMAKFAESNTRATSVPILR